MLRAAFIGELHGGSITLEVAFHLDDHDLRLPAGQGQQLVQGDLEALPARPLDDLQAHLVLGLGAVGGLVKGEAAEAHRFVHPAGGPQLTAALEIFDIFCKCEVGAKFFGYAAFLIELYLKAVQTHLKI